MLDDSDMRGAASTLSKHGDIVMLAALHHTCRCHIARTFHAHDHVRLTMHDLLDQVVLGHAERVGASGAFLVAHRDVSALLGSLTYIDGLPA
jgi:hypothetical protein